MIVYSPSQPRIFLSWLLATETMFQKVVFSQWSFPQAKFQYTEEHKVRTYKEYHSVRPSSELALPPTPHPQASVLPPPCFWGEGNTRWRERGWESPNSDEGHTLWYSLYVRTLCRRGWMCGDWKIPRLHFMCRGTQATLIRLHNPAFQFDAHPDLV
jgi:hypothetical protein